MTELNACAKAPEQPQVLAQLSILENAAKTNTELLNKLSGRLIPITKEPASKPAGVCEEKSGLCELAIRIRAVSDSIRENNDKLEDLFLSLQI